MIPMFNVDLKELIFLVVFAGIIAVPIILSVLSKKKNTDKGKRKDES